MGEREAEIWIASFGETAISQAGPKLLQIWAVPTDFCSAESTDDTGRNFPQQQGIFQQPLWVASPSAVLFVGQCRDQSWKLIQLTNNLKKKEERSYSWSISVC